MKVKFITFILFYTILNSFSFAQQKCPDLENELKFQKAKNEELSKENRYYKETLGLLKPIQSVKIEGLQLDITSIVGSKADKTVTVTFMYKNIEAETRSFFQCEQAYFIDSQGNQAQTYEVFVSFNNGIRAENIEPNIPTKATITFKTTETTFPIIRQLKIIVYSKVLMTKNNEAIFENLDVVWK
ncbi:MULTISPECIES: hypothetical protein [Empedobacter]|uniref:Uncharacterized protein n=2 Tax=Empedobacter TaxID=59734 RepID=A0A3R8TUN6_9FLAO|nr:MULTISPECIES: hypothetical protein [Empedobacter]RRT86406.1 hypothetical protein EGI88_14700 [Empedobacter falsenii]RRT87470.1 hypothetical protein EGI89_14670 [Empedobacter falsenii]TGN24335.1 hypothetical protein E4J94_13925 [Empedobacter tilapiae]